MTGTRRPIYAQRNTTTDTMTLSGFDGPTYATLTRDDAYRLASDIIDLFQFPAASAQGAETEHCPDNLGGPGPHSCIYCGDFLPCSRASAPTPEPLEPPEYSDAEIAELRADFEAFARRRNVSPEVLAMVCPWLSSPAPDAETPK